MAGLRLSNGEQLACTQRSWHQLSTNSYGRYGNKTQKTLRSATEVKLFGFAQEALLFPFLKCMLKKKKKKKGLYWIIAVNRKKKISLFNYNQKAIYDYLLQKFFFLLTDEATAPDIWY